MNLRYPLLLPSPIPQDHPGSHDTVPHHQPGHAGPTPRCIHLWTTNAPESHQPSSTGPKPTTHNQGNSFAHTEPHHHAPSPPNPNSSHQSINHQLPTSNSAICFPLPSPIRTTHDTHSPHPRHQLNLPHRPTDPGPKHQLSPPQRAPDGPPSTADPHHSTAQPIDCHRQP